VCEFVPVVVTWCLSFRAKLQEKGSYPEAVQIGKQASPNGEILDETFDSCPRCCIGLQKPITSVLFPMWAVCPLSTTPHAGVPTMPTELRTTGLHNGNCVPTSTTIHTITRANGGLLGWWSDADTGVPLPESRVQRSMDSLPKSRVCKRELSSIDNRGTIKSM
jgi:hypothetical protein